MKIGILTQPLMTNYGGLLQNYALQQVLMLNGHTVETIDWGLPHSLYYKLYQIKFAMMSYLRPHIYSRSYQPTKRELSVIQENTDYFIFHYIKKTITIHKKSDFGVQAHRGNYDAFIVGSDQCWRPCYNEFLSSMFLDFTKSKNVKRISYAASFGTDVWEFSQKQTKECACLAKLFDLVTVREDTGVNLCKDYLGIDAVHVLDPTMLLTKEDYIKLISIEKELPSAGSLFNYILDPDKRKTDFITRVATDKGLKAFQVLPKYQAENRTKENVKKSIDKCVFPRVTTWLRAFMDAEMTIVDSFHGMVFSIIFNKPFWVIGNTSRGMSRFNSLLKVFNLENRLLSIDQFDNVDISQPIDWNSVNLILREKRNECISLLINKLNE